MIEAVKASHDSGILNKEESNILGNLIIPASNNCGNMNVKIAIDIDTGTCTLADM